MVTMAVTHSRGTSLSYLRYLQEKSISKSIRSFDKFESKMHMKKEIRLKYLLYRDRKRQSSLKPSFNINPSSKIQIKPLSEILWKRFKRI